MSYTTFSRNHNNQMQEPMFFGQTVNVSRYDQQKYPIFEKLIEKQLKVFKLYIITIIVTNKLNVQPLLNVH